MSSKIEWTGITWNPTTGCDKISAGCRSCYAEVMTRRLKAMGQEKYKDGWAFRMHDDWINTPYSWKKPQIVFVNSMSDLFHKDMEFSFLLKLFNVMSNTRQHTYQVLTKRADILLNYSDSLFWTDNIWMGVSVEDGRVTNRIDLLRKTGAKIKFLSCEPLIGPLDNLNLDGISWLICGGESGGKKRKMDLAWARSLRDQCKAAGVPFFMKQIDKIQPIPDDLMIREFPKSFG